MVLGAMCFGECEGRVGIGRLRGLDLRPWVEVSQKSGKDVPEDVPYMPGY